LAFVTIIGALTAFVAATIALVQTDIKRVIAYSTMSQLGYMFAAAGVGVYQAAMFHLFTHAFFKAMLFLGAGSVINAMHHEQDMRNYGGLRKKIPLTFMAMMIGTLAITGVGIPGIIAEFGDIPIGFAGFVSKDAIIESTYAAGTGVGQFAFVLLVLAAAMTAFYSWRLMFLTFYGEAKGDKKKHEHAHESPWTMTVPLVVLAVGSTFAGMIWYKDFFGEAVGEFFGGAVFINESTNKVLEAAHHVPGWVGISPFIAMAFGVILAWIFYIKFPKIPGALATQFSLLYRFLLNKWYFDEVYDVLFVRSAKWIGHFMWKVGDGKIIDGTINGVALGIVPFFTRLAGRMQSGYLFHYALAMVLGIVALITWMSISGGAV
jgi:NADH-quinone oxidoreductase subunit L